MNAMAAAAALSPRFAPPSATLLYASSLRLCPCSVDQWQPAAVQLQQHHAQLTAADRRELALLQHPLRRRVHEVGRGRYIYSALPGQPAQHRWLLARVLGLHVSHGRQLGAALDPRADLCAPVHAARAREPGPAIHRHARQWTRGCVGGVLRAWLHWRLACDAGG